VQSFTQEFRRRSLVLGVDLSSQETLLKYIGALHSYLRHTILMFNPSNLDEVCVQETHLEARGRNETHECSMIQVYIGVHPPFPTGSKQFSDNFGNLLFLASFNFRGHFEGLNEYFL
jgi:hypothetical protein